MSLYSELAGTETIHFSTMRGGSQSNRYYKTFKSFKVEELLGETLPSYFKDTNIE